MAGGGGSQDGDDAFGGRLGAGDQAADACFDCDEELLVVDLGDDEDDPAAAEVVESPDPFGHVGIEILGDGQGDHFGRICGGVTGHLH